MAAGHPPARITRVPTVGARSGDAAMNRNSRDRTRAAWSRGKKSRTMATDAT